MKVDQGNLTPLLIVVEMLSGSEMEPAKDKLEEKMSEPEHLITSIGLRDEHFSSEVAVSLTRGVGLSRVA